MSKPNSIITLFKVSGYVFLGSLRNPVGLFFGFVFPLMFIAVFGLISQGERQYRVGVLEGSVESGPVYEAVSSINAINLDKGKTDEELMEELENGQLGAAIKIEEVSAATQESPPFYSLDLITSSAAPQDGASIQGILSNVVASINNPPNPEATKLVEFEVDTVEGRKYTQIDFILPGQLSFALLSTGVFTISFSIIGLRKTLVLKRMAATPTPRWVILGAKVISSLVMATIQAIVIISVGYFFFDFTLVNGGWTFLQMLLLSMLGLLVFLAFGLFVPSIATTEDAASPVANLITMPQFLLSGAFFSIEYFPDFLQTFARLLPMTFLNDAMRKIAFEGGGIQEIQTEVLALFLWGAVIYLITLKIFKWE